MLIFFFNEGIEGQKNYASFKTSSYQEVGLELEPTFLVLDSESSCSVMMDSVRVVRENL